jgi:lysophospholipase L1-like esterase
MVQPASKRLVTEASIADPASAPGQYLASAYAGVYAARPGNRIAYLGDSITQGSWVASSNFQGTSFPLYAMLSSGGRLLTAANAGVSGDTTAGMLSRFDTDVAPVGPTAVVLLGGTNDMAGTVTLAQYAANVRAIVAKTRALGAVPVLCTIPPNNTTARHAKINTWNAWMRYFASGQGITVVDFYGLLADPVSGNYLSTYAGDGTHPNGAGYIAMGQLVSSALSPLSPDWKPYLSQDNADPLNALSTTNSVMLTDAGADGVPDGWFAYGGSTGYAHALVTDTSVKGKMAQITQTSNASLRSIQKSFAGVSAGDRIALAGVVTSDGGVRAQAKFTFTGPGTSATAMDFTSPITRGVFYQEVTVPSGTTGVVIDLIANPGTGVVAFGQVTGVNFTTNAILSA